MRLLNSFLPSRPIHLNSKYATYTDSKYIFRLDTAIMREENHLMLISLVSGNIPHSYYNINSNNNIIYYIENSTTKTLTITSKNYNVNDLVSYLNSNWTNFTTTYTISTNKYTFANSTYDFTILSTSALDLLGLSKANHISTSKVLYIY